MTKLDQRWVTALERADETGDLRPLLELLLTQKLPDWMIAELAHLFTSRRLDVSDLDRFRPSVVEIALFEYQTTRRSGVPVGKRVEAVVKKNRLSEEQQAALQNLIDGKGRPSSRYRQENKQIAAAIKYEESLRALLNAYPNSTR